jgi:hypothetical protein
MIRGSKLHPCCIQASGYIFWDFHLRQTLCFLFTLPSNCPVLQLQCQHARPSPRRSPAQAAGLSTNKRESIALACKFCAAMLPASLPLRTLRAHPLNHALEQPLPQFLVSIGRLRRLDQTPTSYFSTTTMQCRDNNRVRGLSAMRRSGLRGKRLSIQPWELPKPVVDPIKRSKLEVDADHGLWGFFNKDKTLLSEPQEDSNHGKISRRVMRQVGVNTDCN